MNFREQMSAIFALNDDEPSLVDKAREKLASALENADLAEPAKLVRESQSTFIPSWFVLDLFIAAEKGKA